MSGINPYRSPTTSQEIECVVFHSISDTDLHARTSFNIATAENLEQNSILISLGKVLSPVSQEWIGMLALTLKPNGHQVIIR